MIVSIIVAVLVIVYVIAMYVAFQKQIWIFKPQYPTGPKGACFPLVGVKPLTADQITNVRTNVQKAATAQQPPASS